MSASTTFIAILVGHTSEASWSVSHLRNRNPRKRRFVA